MPSPQLSLKPLLKNSITLELRHSLQLLSFNKIELHSYVQKMLQENPFLEEAEANNLSFRFLHNRESKSEFWVQNIKQEMSLQEYMQKQISMLSVPMRLQSLMRHIISSSDENGFVNTEHAHLAQAAGFSRIDAKRAIDFLKKLDPIGMGAKNHWQALLWQAEILYPHEPVLADIIHLLEQAQGNSLRLNFSSLQQLSEALLLPISLVEKKIKILKKMEPFPAATFFSAAQKKTHVIPDIIYQENEQGETEIFLEGYLVPNLRINYSLYQKDVRKQMDSSWQEKFLQAENLLRALRYRQDSLQRLAEILLSAQEDFFAHGISYLRPLNLNEVAKILHVSISTVSRLTAQKYCQCKWGVFSLKTFFPAYIKSHDEKIRSAQDLQNSILAIVVSEETALSDQAITHILQNQGFNVQRRTVAKYRKLLHIPSAFRRKA